VKSEAKEKRVSNISVNKPERNCTCWDGTGQFELSLNPLICNFWFFILAVFQRRITLT